MTVHEDSFRRGLELFNKGKFFDAHEVLEDVWRAAPMAEKKFLQGLIQIAVGLHHHSRGNIAGARSLLVRGNRNLSLYAARHEGVHLARLRAAVTQWSAALGNGTALPSYPTIEA